MTIAMALRNIILATSIQFRPSPNLTWFPHNPETCLGSGAMAQCFSEAAFILAKD
tara:strand:- start:547 stop:711 length:165 start_codon:yes stop_codon:yes gene_type:complete